MRTCCVTVDKNSQRMMILLLSQWTDVGTCFEFGIKVFQCSLRESCKTCLSSPLMSQGHTKEGGVRSHKNSEMLLIGKTVQ
uniref:Secreted protein n=1 Tax=Parascaris univalens TaxID=6257 RepID=A0A915A3Z8_PARUN